MPIDLGLWEIDDDDNFDRVSSTKLDKEGRLKDFLLQDPNVLGQPLLVIDEEITTSSGKRLDILAIDSSGDLHVIELKRDRSPRDVTAQVVDYASWVRNLSYDDVKRLYEEADDHEDTFEAGFSSEFRPDGEASGPEEVNSSHSLTIVASELDGSTERIIEYLSEEYDVPINAVRFNYYQNAGREYLARTWLNDPYEVDETSEESTERASWNGHDFYGNYGVNSNRKWSDAREYGFISAGGGEWYHRTMDNATEGSRLFVYHPGEGYIGVGTITREKTPAPEFMVEEAGEEIPITEADLDGDLSENQEDSELREYLLGIDWEETVDVDSAVWESDMYSQQNTITKLRDQYTLDRLYDAFDVSPPE